MDFHTTKELALCLVFKRAIGGVLGVACLNGHTGARGMGMDGRGRGGRYIEQSSLHKLLSR